MSAPPPLLKNKRTSAGSPSRSMSARFNPPPDQGQSHLFGAYGILQHMTKELKEVLERAETWPEEDQEELADYVRDIEARRTGVYHASAEELVAIDEAF